jgi:hypothetical protein
MLYLSHVMSKSFTVGNKLCPRHVQIDLRFLFTCLSSRVTSSSVQVARGLWINLLVSYTEISSQ